MAISSEILARIRVTALGVTGLGCLTYAAMALWMGRPDPVGWYWTGLTGLTAGVVITLATVLAGRQSTGMAFDELHDQTNHRAQRHAYWLSLVWFGVFSLAAAQGWIEFRTAMAAFGCLMGASYLLLFVLYDLRTR